MLLEEDVRNVVWQDYMALTAQAIGTAILSVRKTLTGEKELRWPYPSWNELMHPVSKDTRTGTQIMDEIRAKLGGE